MANRVNLVIFIVLLLQYIVSGIPVVDPDKVCNFVFNVEPKPKDGNAALTSVSMTDLNKIMTNDELINLKENICNLIIALQPNVGVVADAVSKIPTTVISSVPTTKSPVTVPLTTRRRKPSTTTYRPPIQNVPSDQILPIYENQMVIFPTITNEGTPIVADDQDIQIVDKRDSINPDGSTEYTLILSNGVVHYQKSHIKKIKDEEVMVHEGYFTEPITGTNKFQTQYYVSDENGHQVYKVVQHTGNVYKASEIV